MVCSEPKFHSCQADKTVLLSPGILPISSLYEVGFEALCWIHLWLAELHFVGAAALFPANFKLSAQVHTFQRCCDVSAHLPQCVL